MSHATTTTSLEALVHKCNQLCSDAEKSIRGISGDREQFLGQNLEGALQQLELILRVVGENKEPHRDEERQGFLRRLFSRNDKDGAEGEDKEEFYPPSFDVSTQGLHGNAATISLAEVLSFLAFTHKTGVLWIDSPQENFLIGLVDGKLRHASSDHTPEGLRLGEVLVGLGFLTRRQLERYLQADPDAGISGEALLESGLIANEELAEALTHQVTALFQRLVRLNNAVFRYQDGLNVQLEHQVQLDVNQLLLDTARQSDEGDNPTQAAAAVLQDWDSWRTELSSIAGPPVSSGSHPAQPRDAAEASSDTKAAADAAESKAETPEAVANTSNKSEEKSDNSNEANASKSKDSDSANSKSDSDGSSEANEDDKASSGKSKKGAKA